MPDSVDAGGVTYEVVSYSDVRAVAADAASDALERQSVRTTADIEAVAAAAAEDALVRRELSDSEARAEWEQAQSEALVKLSEDAASSALEGVQSKLDAQLAAIDERAESRQAVVAVIDSEQWEVLVGTHQAFAALLVFEVVLLGAILGALLWLSVLARRA